MSLKRVLSNPLTEEEAKSLTDEEKQWLRSWNRAAEIPGEDEPAADDSSTGDSGDQSYNDKSVDELKDVLKERGLPVSGNKDELIARLEEDDASNG